MSKVLIIAIVGVIISFLAYLVYDFIVSEFAHEFAKGYFNK
jgi:hypothetical protein